MVHMRCSLKRAVLLLVLLLVVGLAKEQDDIRHQNQANVLIDEAVYSQANVNGIPVAFVQAARSGDETALYQIAKHIQEDNVATSTKIFHLLADRQPTPSTTPLQHKIRTASQVSLGFLYHGEKLKDREKALHYFTTAGENGPHQAALYNAGRMYAEDSNWVPALAYIQAAARWQQGGKNDGDEAEVSRLTQTCQQAYEIISWQIATIQESLSIQELADIFMYGSLEGYPPSADEQDNTTGSAHQATELWKAAVHGLLALSDTKGKSKKQVFSGVDREKLETVVTSLRQIWEHDSTKLSNLQAYLLLKQINKALGQLAGVDRAYVPAAAGYAEALALSAYCQQQQQQEYTAQAGQKSPLDHAPNSCFTDAATTADLYYRQDMDIKGSQRIAKLVSQHDFVLLEMMKAQVQSDGAVAM